MKAGAAIAGGATLGGGTAGTAMAVSSDVQPESDSVDMFLRLEGIKGESRDRAHEGEIDVLAWSWGAANNASLHVARGGGRGGSTFDDISITKRVDRATPALWLGVASGRHIPSATLTLRTAGGDEQIAFLVIELEPVLVSSVHPGGVVDEQQLETISLNFARFRVTYTPQEPDGTPGPSVGPVGWDIQRSESV